VASGEVWWVGRWGGWGGVVGGGGVMGGEVWWVGRCGGCRDGIWRLHNGVVWVMSG
jgi:hypothetical protein